MSSFIRLLQAALMVVGAARAADAKFAVLPSAANGGDRQTITFSLAGKTDVEVAVLDAKGAVVRRLAAGVIDGDKAPPEPLKPGLSQSLNWDGKDDFGKSAQGGPFKVRVRAGLGHMAKVEIEVDTLAQLEEALSLGADTILLDNMTPDDLRRAVVMAKNRATLEASGNVTLTTVRAIAETGVDYISSGAITHSAVNLDIGLDF